MWSKTITSLTAAAAIALGAGAASAIPLGSTTKSSAVESSQPLLTPAQTTTTTVKKRTVTRKGDTRVVKKKTTTKTVRRDRDRSSVGLTIALTPGFAYGPYYHAAFRADPAAPSHCHRWKVKRSGVLQRKCHRHF
jgi:hypothetical protein